MWSVLTVQYKENNHTYFVDTYDILASSKHCIGNLKYSYTPIKHYTINCITVTKNNY